MCGELRKLLESLKDRFKRENVPDIRDIHVYGGLFLAGTGLFMWSPALSFTIIGFILFIMGAPFPRGPK